MELRLVRGAQHAPLVQFLVVFWPLILLALAVPLAGQVKPLAGFLAAVFLALLAFSELFNAFDGGYTGDFLRFNSALKWWGWIFTGGVFSISACLFASDRFAVRAVCGQRDGPRFDLCLWTPGAFSPSMISVERSTEAASMRRTRPTGA